MKKVILFFAMLLLTPPGVYSAPEPDYYLGDTSVYAGSTVNVPPNIMFFIDTSQQMAETGSSGTYLRDDSIDYTAGLQNPYSRNTIYYKNKDNYQTTGMDLSDIQANCSSPPPERTDAAYPTLLENGNWIGCLKNGSYCTNKTEDYYTGDYLNWKEQAANSQEWSAETTYEFGDVVYAPGDSSEDQKYKCVKPGLSGGINPFPATADLAATYADGEVSWQPQASIIEVIEAAMNQTIFPFLESQGVRVGLMKYGGTQGGAVVAPIANHTASELAAFMTNTIKPDPYNQTANAQPLGSALWDAWLYWVGDPQGTSHANSAYQGNPDSDSPIEYWCQSNHMIVLATGATKDNLGESNPLAQMDNGDDYYSPEAANYLYESLDYSTNGIQSKVKTHIIQMMTSEISQLVQAASDGHGLYVNVSESSQILEALIDIILAVLEADSSYVAPVVPASPESQLYSGERIYLGFFKPMNDEPWYGNIKKFAFDQSNRMQGFDTAGALTGATDEEGEFLADNNGNPAIRSFWSTAADGRQVDAGGVGERLFDLFATPPAVPGNRKLIFGSSLTSFTSANLTKEQLTVETDAEKDSLIQFIYGLDAYNEYDGDMRHWIKGDVMHSKPVIMNYSNYDFNLENEVKCDTNKTYIFVGGNDGMLHAYRDCDGKEVWGFIPDEFLANLKYLRDFDHHYYFMDGAPVIFFHDQNNDNTITASEDAVVLIVGMRRGGGKSTLGSGGGDSTYYALDITNPENPEFLWKINNNTSGFTELGQTWSLPTLALMQLGEPKTAKVVAIFGAGYDTNEDLRYGAAQDFPDADDTTVTSSASSGEGNLSSNSGAGPYAPSGRGCFAVEVASFNPSAEKKVVLKTSPTRLWSYTESEDESGRMQFSFPSDPLVFDRDLDGFDDTAYLGDTGGQLWRFDMQSSDTTNWNATCIFAANDGFTSDPPEVGRKIFYKPTATLSGDDTFVYFGTGDREHPLNTAVTDRIYAIRDRRIPVGLTDTTAISDYNTNNQLWDYSSGPLTEANLVDVTAYDYTTAKLDQLRPPYQDRADNAPDKSVKYGWFIKLNEADRGREKVLASGEVFDGVVLFTTYEPIAPGEGDDPCVGVLGRAWLYPMDAFTGQAAFNLSSDNDSDNQLVIGRPDRSMSIGRGIASEPLIKMDRKGNVSVLVGRGSGFYNSANDEGALSKWKSNPLFDVYWMKW
ncbi:pilus assembly protein [Trichloromonas sp.]|uniref:pilus assembly protein n=1 Tax=Trichloromonas sp. TaxID=3069249 RepID=UPI002A3EC869|nr:PilC/PilY family type IV pilus protein [Trichloromonas sp.]